MKYVGMSQLDIKPGRLVTFHVKITSFKNLAMGVATLPDQPGDDKRGGGGQSSNENSLESSSSGADAGEATLDVAEDEERQHRHGMAQGPSKAEPGALEGVGLE